jgi:hypothetical protein
MHEKDRIGFVSLQLLVLAIRTSRAYTTDNQREIIILNTIAVLGSQELKATTGYSQ